MNPIHIILINFIKYCIAIEIYSREVDKIHIFNELINIQDYFERI